jgi:hypothetical protein
MADSTKGKTLSKGQRLLLELEARAKPLTDLQLSKLNLEKARDYYDAQCDAMSIHARMTGHSAFQIGRILYRVNEQLGNSRTELEAWLAQSKHPRSVSGAYQYIKLFREQGKIRAAGELPEEISFRAARVILTESRAPLVPAVSKARNRQEGGELARQRENMGTRGRAILEWILDHGEPAQVDEVFEAASRFVREVRARRQRGAAVREEE